MEKEANQTYFLTTEFKNKNLYQQKREIEIRYGLKGWCGYLRQPKIKGIRIIGQCSLTNNKGKCNRKIPMDMKNCYAYQSFMNQIKKTNQINTQTKKTLTKILQKMGK